MHKIASMPTSDRPRERLVSKGVGALSDYELLAIILRTGTLEMSALDVAKNLIVSIGDLNNLRNITLSELKKYKGIKEVKAIEIIAAIEFGKRVCLSKKDLFIVNDSKQFYDYIKYDISHLEYEEFRVAFLNRRSEIIDIKTLSIGGFDNTKVDFRDIIRWALKLSCYHILVFHNHPSGDPIPSFNDKVFTKDLIDYADSMGVNVIDHIIIGRSSYYSFSENNNNS